MTGYSAMVTAVLAALALIMLLDWLSVMSVAERLVAMGIAMGAVAWVFRRYASPWLGRREDEIDMALLVQRQEHIDSDLVAALQFESPAAPWWGSPELEKAVIQRAAELGRDVDLRGAVPRRELRRRLFLVLMMVVLWGALVGVVPQHVAVFFNRLLLGSHHYPSRTAIAEITINGCQVEPSRPGLYPIRVPAGCGVQFSVNCTGCLPQRGEVRLSAGHGEAAALVELAAGESLAGEYHGELLCLQESVAYQVLVGDAWTDPGRLEIVPLPVADVALQVEPPAYAAELAAAGRLATGLRQVSVVEGSRVVVRLVAKKQLRKAWLTLAAHKYPLALENSETKSAPETWILDPADTPLASVVELLQYSIQVSDIDGLALEKPIEGMIHIQPDLRPRVAAAMVTPQVLPRAAPVIHWRALDDFGLARVAIQHHITRTDGQTEEGEAEIYRQAGQRPPRKDVQSDYELNLEPLKLKKNDMVRITLRATDYRGPREGQSGQSEPLMLHVTDLEGVLSMVTEPDRKSAEQLKTMVDRQLGIGGGK